MDVNEAEITFAGENIGYYFLNGFAIFEAPEIQTIIHRDGIMGYHGVPQMPVFSYMTVQDEVSKFADTDALMNRYCQLGVNILYLRNAIGTHLEEAQNSLSAAMEWLSAVLSGSYANNYNTMEVLSRT